MAKRVSVSIEYDTVEDVQKEMSSDLAFYRNAKDGEVIGGILKPKSIAFHRTKADKFMDVVAGTDHLRRFY